MNWLTWIIALFVVFVLLAAGFAGLIIWIYRRDRSPENAPGPLEELPDRTFYRHTDHKAGR